MNSNLLRQLWDLIETTQTETLTQLDDRQLIQVLMSDLKAQSFLQEEEEVKVMAYIRSRLLLIRELAQARQDLYCPIRVPRRSASMLSSQIA
ncbi:MAG: hypothetical protein HC934_05270 [Acaryochloridaceae cyanobacterium SU_2_1]|nr:hypothetical protein [Acaryochloridaceae cyanobacterium SU_2_1]NJM95608.1 hypothetical protein [Acaryochloridaceae cyanobacterium CSU_5_19]